MHREGDEGDSEVSRSFQDRIQSDPEYRDAYFNTTSAHLFADPDEASTNRILAKLQECAVAYLFTPDEYLARPLLQTEFGQFVGEDEICRAIGRLVVPSIYPQTAQATEGCQ